ncbi:MAG: M42 family metallopeptidase [Ruminococcaceae bacterium]|nr:M42 family metallopeptidase [Oscillospiraceae bacterium]
MKNTELLKKLCTAIGVSGSEEKVRDIILAEVEKIENTEVKISNLGDIIVLKKGELTPKKKLMISAHMDEVGLMVNDILEDGSLKFILIGGVNAEVLLSKRVYVNENTLGVIGGKPVHLMSADEKEKVVPIKELSIDIGALNKEDAEKYVSVGDVINFEPVFEADGSKITAKSLDDRIGCYLLLETMKENLPFDTYFVFTTREEVGAIGAAAVSPLIDPDFCISVEGTVAGDVLGKEGAEACTTLGKGIAVSLKDRGTLYDPKLIKLAFKLCKENGIKIQPRALSAGSTDAMYMHKTKNGARAMGLSVPTRYIHSPISMCFTEDIEAAERFLPIIISEILTDD